MLNVLAMQNLNTFAAEAISTVEPDSDGKTTNCRSSISLFCSGTCGLTVDW